jgi:serine protease
VQGVAVWCRPMRCSCLRLRWLAGVLMAALAQAQALAQPSPAAAAPLSSAAAERFIVKLRATSVSSGHEAAPGEIRALAARQGLILTEVRHIVSGMHLVQVQPAAAQSATQTLARLRADSEVEYAEVDQRRYAQTTPNDPLFVNQWYLQDTQAAATDAFTAWNTTTGSPGLVIADLDTGVRFDHPDLRNASANRLLPGYNLISNAAIANNAEGRGADASDPGDWVSAADLKNPVFANCQVANSSWHGTRTAGILGAITNNQAGIAGMTWQGWIEPVRVLGKCGGYDSDILAGMAWAAGNPVNGVPENPYPAQIINMSLGAAGSCPQSYQQMVDELVAEGVLVVVAAGNEGGPVDAPANCSGVAGVAGLRQVGTKVGYSSLGPQIALSAPAGNCVNTGAGQPCLFSIQTTSNSGTTVPETNIYTDEYNFNVGTSFSAPIVAGIAGLMLAVNGNLSSGQLIARLQQGATGPFPVSTDPSVPACHVPSSASDLQTAECSCTTDTCGAGMANAHTAVLQALRPIAAVALPSSFSAGSAVLLDGSGSAAACNATLSSYHWSVVQPASNPPAIMNANSARASIIAPGASSSYTLLLTVTDDVGRSDSATVVVQSDNATTTAPASAGFNACLAAVAYSQPSASSAATGSSGSGGGGGGGGGIDLLTLLMLALGGGSLSALRRHNNRCAASSHGRCARR